MRDYDETHRLDQRRKLAAIYLITANCLLISLIGIFGYSGNDMDLIVALSGCGILGLFGLLLSVFARKEYRENFNR